MSIGFMDRQDDIEYAGYGEDQMVSKFLESQIDAEGRLTDQQVAAGVRALRETRRKFGDNQDDQALVYAVVYAVLLAHIPNPSVPNIGEFPDIKR